MSAASRFTIDGILLVAFISAYNPAVTGLSIHEWLSLGLVFLAIFHMALNWDWMVRVTVTFLARVRAMSRINLVVDLVLFVSTVTVMLSGFVVSRIIGPSVGLSPSTDLLWHSVHSTSADVTVLAFSLHGVLHWRWISSVLFGRAPARGTFTRSSGSRARRSEASRWAPPARSGTRR